MSKPQWVSLLRGGIVKLAGNAATVSSMNPQPSQYRGYRFPPEIIAHAVWLYFRFPLSLRLVEEMLLERDIGAAAAIATSIRATLVNWRVMTGWAALILMFTAAGIVTGCLGLIITMPLIGHASWHAYRDLVPSSN